VDRKYRVPIGSMLAGLAFWIVPLVWLGTNGGSAASWPWAEVGLCFVAGGLIVFSGFS
jgi:hypothetical protein